MYNDKVMKSALESMMFVWGEPLKVKDAAEVLDADKKVVKDLFLDLQREYAMMGRGIRIREVDGAFQFVTHAENEMSKDLVDVAGRSEGVGRPLLYKTTGEFLKKFGFASIKDLPDITEFDDIEEYDEETPHEQLSINFEGDADSEDK